MHRTIKENIEGSLKLKQIMLGSKEIADSIAEASCTIISAYRSGRKLILAGNGGSAADAQHIAAELVNRFGFERPGLSAIALTTDTSVLTSVGNDSGFDHIFARQAEAIGNEGDVFIAISTSGNSVNLVEALKVCRRKKIFTVGLTGSNIGLMYRFCDICIKIPSLETPRIQEAHILTGHIICSLVENELFPNLK